VSEHRGIQPGFKFAERGLLSNAQSGLLVLAANIPMTLGLHSRVLQRISGSGLLTFFFANGNYLLAFIAHLCEVVSSRPLRSRWGWSTVRGPRRSGTGIDRVHSLEGRHELHPPGLRLRFPLFQPQGQR
jgi:hypothetical protein